MAAEQLTIDRITYDVLASDPVEAIAARGLTQLAEMMRAEGRTRQMTLRRPRGRALFLGIEWQTKYGGKTYRVVPMEGVR